MEPSLTKSRQLEVFDVEQLDFAYRYRQADLFYNKALEFHDLIEDGNFSEAADVIDDSLIGEDAVELILASRFGQRDTRVRGQKEGEPYIVKLVKAVKECVDVRNECPEFASEEGDRIIFDLDEDILYTAEKLQEKYTSDYECYKKTFGHNARVYKSFVEKAIELGETFQEISDLCDENVIDLSKVLDLSFSLCESADDFFEFCESSYTKNGDRMPSQRQFSGTSSSCKLSQACSYFNEDLGYIAEETDYAENLRKVRDTLKEAFRELSSDCQYYIELFAPSTIFYRAPSEH